MYLQRQLAQTQTKFKPCMNNQYDYHLCVPYHVLVTFYYFIEFQGASGLGPSIPS